MPGYYIGPYPFINISTFPLGETTQMDIEARPGVEGVHLFNLGKRGKPFQVETVVDVTNVLAAGVLMTYYEQMIGGVYPVMFATWAMPKMYCVLDVVPIPEGTRQILLGVGGTGGGVSYGILHAVWTLIAVNHDLQV